MRPHVSIDIQLSEDDLAAALRADVLRGLTASRKWLPSKWFYDAQGSKLFELAVHGVVSDFTSMLHSWTDSDDRFALVLAGRG